MSKAEQIPKNFISNDVEARIYKLWEDSGYFKPENHPHPNREKPFVITLPPPNANGSLHLGHASGYTNQDLMGRYHRMKGDRVLLLPGKDHAGIQTEVLFTKILEKKGIKKRELGREKFYEETYRFCIENSEIARNQEKSMGLSADYSREKFTLDPEVTKVVMETFEKMVSEGIVYRGKRIVNWCVRDQTSLANIDTEKLEEQGFLYDVRYEITDTDGKGTAEYIVISTTRPETMFGDTAIAVNPNDERYTHLIGKLCRIPYSEETGMPSIPIVSDHRIDKEFGTGAVKVTPAHSEIDFEIKKDHDLEVKEVIDQYGKMFGPFVPSKYLNFKVEECRKLLVEDLKKDGFLVGEPKLHMHIVPVCERCKGKIEPLLQWQWFVKVSELKKKAIDAVESGETAIHPKAQEKGYLRWMENLEDWCISRQLWWGHQIPMWYCGGKEFSDRQREGTGTIKVLNPSQPCGEYFYLLEKPQKCPYCAGVELQQETDVFDTWFSSGQWPMSVFGGPGTKDFDLYYPTTVLETAKDILFFWVARMMMLCTYRTKKAPFSHVYLHGLVTDREGKKMSKSRGNGIEPAEMISKYGADALRFTFMHGNAPALSYRIYDEKVRSFRNFVNKIWNGARFALMQFDEVTDSAKTDILLHSQKEILSKRLDSLKVLGNNITKNIETYKLGRAATDIYEFWWHTFCDIYIEEIKAEMVNTDESKKQELLSELLSLLTIQLKLLHPFVPFVTEEIWQTMKEMSLTQKDESLLMIAKWPFIFKARP